MGTKLLIFAGLLILFATGTGFTLTYLFGRKEEKRKSLSDTLKMYDTTPKKSFFLKREFVSAKETLVDTDQAGEIPRLIVKCVIGVTIGIFAAFVLFGSILLAVIFGLTGFMVPLWRLKFYKNKHKKYLARQLESATFLISTTYIRGGNIEEAINENNDDYGSI